LWETDFDTDEIVVAPAKMHNSEVMKNILHLPMWIRKLPPNFHYSLSFMLPSSRLPSFSFYLINREIRLIFLDFKYLVTDDSLTQKASLS
jgi:hypothetical protein